MVVRNPLNVILGYSELFLRLPEIQQSPRIVKMGEALRRNAQSQSQLISESLRGVFSALERLQFGAANEALKRLTPESLTPAHAALRRLVTDSREASQELSDAVTQRFFTHARPRSVVPLVG